MHWQSAGLHSTQKRYVKRYVRACPMEVAKGVANAYVTWHPWLPTHWSSHFGKRLP